MWLSPVNRDLGGDKLASNILEKRVLVPIRMLLSQGVTPEKMSQALATGFVLGMTPMLGISSILAVAVAAFFRLNQVAIQIANYAAYPAQILMFIPFVRTGEWVFGLASAAINPSDIASMFSDDFQASIQLYGQSLLAGWIVWLLSAVPLTLMLSWLLKFLLSRYFARSAKVS